MSHHIFGGGNRFADNNLHLTPKAKSTFKKDIPLSPLSDSEASKKSKYMKIFF